MPVVPGLLTVVVAIIAGIIAVVTLPIVPAVFATDVMTVDPMMMVLGPMARNPNHFIVAMPVTGAVTVIWPISEFDPDFLCWNRGRENDARGRYGGE